MGGEYGYPRGRIRDHMRHFKTTVAIAAIATIVLSGCKQMTPNGNGPLPPAITRKVLAVPLVGQQTEVWCWAAASEMIFRYYSVGTTQCRILTAWVGVDCCNYPTYCRYTAPTVEFIQQTLYGIGGIRSRAIPRALAFHELKSEIDQGRPLIIGYQGSFAGHVVVVYGYDSAGNIYIRDPYYGSFVVPYGSTFVYSGQMYWAATIYNIGR